MSFPFEYDHGAPLAFGGALPQPRSFDDSAIVILPVPVDRTTSYVGGTRNGPREILQASSHMELWDEELGVDVHSRGIFTLPEMELPFGEMGPLLEEIRRVAAEVIDRGKFLVTLGIRSPRRSWPPPRRGTKGCPCCRSTHTRTCGTPTWGPATTTRARSAARWRSRR